jgi:16S rRNA C967 or C1407 C5-methylase (RsmB/RsmF family)
MSRGSAGGRRRRTGSRRGAERTRRVELDRYREIIGDFARFREVCETPEPTVFRVRQGRVPETELLEGLALQGFSMRPLAGLPGFHRVEQGPRSLALTPEHWGGLLYVQQASTGVAAPALGPRPGDRILDLCAAPGGKTTHMADLMGDRGCLVASEISESRIRGLLGNVYRLAHPGVFAVAGDGRDFPEDVRFDRVLVDAPCSGEGTLRRRGGQPPNQSRSFVDYVTAAQRTLLEKAVRVTRPGGTILYVTCTFAPEENEAVVSDALARLPVDLDPLDLPVPHAPGLTSFDNVTYDPRLEGAARIYPHHFDSGGLFLARLRRLDDGSAPDPSLGWTPVPSVFPGEAIDSEAGEALLREGVAEVRDRFGIEADFPGMRWTLRGGRAWMHTVDAWPLPTWTGEGWRPISVGIRAIDFDSRGRPRPTNDFLRWLNGAVGARVVEPESDALLSLLRGDPLETDREDRGPVALSRAGRILGRGAVTVDGLKSEIPRARAADLLRCLVEEPGVCAPRGPGDGEPDEP